MKWNDNKNIFKKFISVIAGILVAIVFSAPYIIFREQIQQMSVVGYVSLIIACAISNISILLPSSSTIIVVTASLTLNPILCVLCGGIGTCLGEQSSYICGRIGAKGFDDNLVQNKEVVRWLKKREFLTIFIFAFVPLPVFDLVGIAAGAMRIKWIKYTIAAVLGKTLKFLVAILGVYYVIPYIIHIIPGSSSSILQQMLDEFGIVY